MGKVQKILERAAPNLEKFEAKAVRQLEEMHQLRKTATRASKAGIRAVKRRNTSAIEYEKARIQDCIQKVRVLDLVAASEREKFVDQMAAELMELAGFEEYYPQIFFEAAVSSSEKFSREKLGVSFQAWYHGLADLPGELGKAVTKFRRGRGSLEEKVFLRERLLTVVQDIISYLSNATDERVLGITADEKKDFRRRFEGKVASIGAFINRLNDEMIELQGRIQFIEEVRQAVREGIRDGVKEGIAAAFAELKPRLVQAVVGELRSTGGSATEGASC